MYTFHPICNLMVMKNNNTLLILGIFLLMTVMFSCKKKTQSEIISPNDAAQLVSIDNAAELDSILDGYIDRGSYPFIYARLENLDGEVLYEHSTVNRSLFPDLVVDKDSWIRIWSMSKIATISIALDLVEDGFLRLDDPVEKYIPEFKNLRVAKAANGENLTTVSRDSIDQICPLIYEPLDSVMTVLHLINHQAGFYYATTGIDCLDDKLAAENLPTSKNADAFIKRLSRLPLIMQPGHGDFYGINTTVLGFVAERASGKSLKDLVVERITDPLAIQGLQYGLPPDSELVPAVSGKDTKLRLAHKGELDIFGPDVPDYAPSHKLYLGGEGMVATADGYADFVRMLANHGELNGERFLDMETVEDIYAPHTQLDNKYGYNGYNLWISGDSMRINGQGDAGLWIGGGYEGTHFWADPKRDFVGVIMTQMFWVPGGDYNRDNAFRGALYRRIFEKEKRSEK